MKFRKKPVVIDAFQFKGGNIVELGKWLATFEGKYDGWLFALSYIEIVTLEGAMRANVGDWIIRGVAGEFYPCKDEIFQKTYEVAE